VSQIGEVVKSPSFVEHALLLILTAVLTGLLVPFINAILADQKFREQRRFEAELARQAKIIDAQNELLGELEKIVYGFQLRALALAWYKTQDKNSAKYQESLKAYEDSSWVFFSDMHTRLGKARRLTSPKVYEELERFYSALRELDSNLVKLVRKDTTEEEWKAFSALIQQSGGQTEHIMNLLAQDYGLSKNTSKYHQQ
jgi:hypothetical protein